MNQPNTLSRVGVLDKSVAILDALELGPQSLNDLVNLTGIARPTAHRLAVALEGHDLVARDSVGRFTLGTRIQHLATSQTGDELVIWARPILSDLRDRTGESTQLYRRVGSERVCVAVADLATGLRDTVPLGARLTLSAGSAAQVLMAWGESESSFAVGLLSKVRERGWAASAGERESGVASVSAPVRGGGDRVIAAVSLSGPIERLGRNPGVRHAPAVMAAAALLSGGIQSAGHTLRALDG